MAPQKYIVQHLRMGSGSGFKKYARSAALPALALLLLPAGAAHTTFGLVVTFTENMIFEPGQSAIRAEALPALREITGFLRSYSGNKVLVKGYTDSSGTLRANIRLSGLRAVGVCKFFSDNGISPERLGYKGLGPADPVAPNDTEAWRARNRRVEVLVLRETV
jgi:chemotaxis protein MotB